MGMHLPMIGFSDQDPFHPAEFLRKRILSTPTNDDRLLLRDMS